MKRRPLLAFFALMFAFSWGVWLPLAIAPRALERWLTAGQVLGSFGPCLAAILVTAAAEGREGVRALFRRFTIWRVGAGWYFVALLLPAGVSLLITVLDMMFGGDTPNFSHPPIYLARLPEWLMQYNATTLLLPIFLLNLIIGGSLGEEPGWRGFALARLQQRYRALDATLMLALVWAIWAQPLLLLQRVEGPVTLQGVATLFLVTLFGGIPAQILTTWIFNSAAGSLLLAVLFNNAIKVTDLFVTRPDTALVVPVAAYWLTTLLVVSAVGTHRLTLRPSLPAEADNLLRAGGSETKA